MYEKKSDIFNQPTIEGAKEVILTNWVKKSAERWEIEAPEIVDTLEGFIKPNAVVCDFGVGIGRIVKPLLEQRSDISIVGVDAAENMLKYCQEYIPSNLQERVQLVLYDSMNDISDDSVDFTLGIYVLQHIPEQDFEKAVQQLHRITKQEGQLYLLNTDKFRAVPKVVPGKRSPWHNDKFPQKEVIAEYFEKIQDVPYQSPYMNEIVKTHFSTLFRPRK